MLKKLLSREEFDDDNVRYDIDDGKDDVVRGMDIWRHNHVFLIVLTFEIYVLCFM